MKTLILAILLYLPLMSFCKVDSPVLFQIIIEVSTPEEICMFEKLAQDESLKNLYSFKMQWVEVSTARMTILCDNEVMGALYGKVTPSFLQKIHPRIDETYNDHARTQSTVLRMQ